MFKLVVSGDKNIWSCPLKNILCDPICIVQQTIDENDQNFWNNSHLCKKVNALILNIETSTEVCSVAIAHNGTVIHSRQNLSGQNHAMLVTVYINELLVESNLTIEQLDAVAVSGGPGSYTGLRIGVSVAKGLCYASRLPMIAITSLEAMTHHVITKSQKFSIPGNGQCSFLSDD